MKTDQDLIRNIGIIADHGAGKATLSDRIIRLIQKRKPQIYEVRAYNPPYPGQPPYDLSVRQPPDYPAEHFLGWLESPRFFEWGKNLAYLFELPDLSESEGGNLRVVDGNILLLDLTQGVAPRWIEQARRIQRAKLPSLAFINKLDLPGDYQQAAKEKLHYLERPPVYLQLPIGAGAQFKGIIDLVKRKAYFTDDSGEVTPEEESPKELIAEAEEHRSELIEVLAGFDSNLREALSTQREVTEAQLKASLRKACLGLKVTPVLLGAALLNKGIQLLLDGAMEYLPSPSESTNTAQDQSAAKTTITLEPDAVKPFVGQVFHWEDGPYGQITYLRVYQGCLKRGDVIVNCSKGNQGDTLRRMVKVYLKEMHDLNEAYAGDIVGIFHPRPECAIGDTLTDGSVYCTMSSS